MPWVMCRMADGQIISSARWDHLVPLPNHVVVEWHEMPNSRTMKWDGVDGLKARTPQEVHDYDEAQPQRVKDRKRDNARAAVARGAAGGLPEVKAALQALIDIWDD